MHVLIFAGGTIRPGVAISQALSTADLVIAADSGATSARQFGLLPNFIVGDFDSLQEPVQSFLDQGSQLLTAPAEKDETDTELALQKALELGATQVTLLGALGGDRVEHEIANLFLLADYPTLPITILDGPSRCWLLHGPGQTTIHGQPDDFVSLFPLTTDATGITTYHLSYPLHNERLRFGKPRGVSNRLTHSDALVSLSQGILLVIHTTLLTTPKDQIQERN